MLVPISAKMPMALRSLMPGMLESKTTACAQLNAAFGGTAPSGDAEGGSDVLWRRFVFFLRGGGGFFGRRRGSEASDNFCGHSINGLFQMVDLREMLSKQKTVMIRGVAF